MGSSVRVPGRPIGPVRRIYAAWAVANDGPVLPVIDNAGGRGLGTEATRLVVEHGLTTMGLHRISLEVYDFNPRARYVYEKVGFVHEGTGRQALRFDDRWIDVHYMAILASDPRG